MKASIRTMILAAMLGLAAPLRSPALINPNFTPVHLVNQSSLIVEVQPGVAKDGKITATVKRVLKGTCDRKSLTLALSTSTFPEHVKTVEKLTASPDGTTGIFFAGGFGEEVGGPAGTAGGAEPGAQRAFLHVAGTWVAFVAGPDGSWQMDQISSSMGTTWNGGTDMLILAAQYILSDPDADVPVREGVLWAGREQFAKLRGPVHAAMPVDVAGDGKLALYVACESGDLLFRRDAKSGEMKDITATVKLAAKSKLATWGDFNADGRMDLLGWDGEALVLCTQGADSTFATGERFLKGSLANGCLGLACMDSGKPGHPLVVISTKTGPLLWSRDEPDRVKPIGAAGAGAALGAPGMCLVADFDGDSFPDILQLFEKGSLIHKGKSLGQFEEAKPCNISLGAGTASAFLGDYDADGLLDVFTVASSSTTRLWSNRGKFSFLDTMSMAGELTYKGGSGSIGGTTGDFNNDGRQDVFFYYDSTSPHLYFSRGFRSFGLANGLELAANNEFPQIEEGQQAGCLADLTGDGAQAMILILKNGEAWAFYLEAGEGTARCARATLSSKGTCIGPLTVSGWCKGRGLGAWNVVAGTSETFVGSSQAGLITLKWQAPGGKPQQKEVLLENAPVRVVLAP